jgi:hypothetical protein
MVAKADIKAIIRDILGQMVGREVRGKIRYEAIFDDDHERYQIIAIGWNNNKQILRPVVMIELINDLVWVQADNTDYNVAGDLVDRGIPVGQIVLGFQLPQERRLSGFAIGE